MYQAKCPSGFGEFAEHLNAHLDNLFQRAGQTRASWDSGPGALSELITFESRSSRRVQVWSTTIEARIKIKSCLQWGKSTTMTQQMAVIR